MQRHVPVLPPLWQLPTLRDAADLQHLLESRHVRLQRLGHERHPRPRADVRLCALDALHVVRAGVRTPRRCDCREPDISRGSKSKHTVIDVCEPAGVIAARRSSGTCLNGLCGHYLACTLPLPSPFGFHSFLLDISLSYLQHTCKFLRAFGSSYGQFVSLPTRRLSRCVAAWRILAPLRFS